VNDRSSRRDVRNPVLALKSAAAIQAMSPDVRATLRNLLRDLAVEARQKANECWRKHKAPMAVYWKAVSVYANHIQRVLA
jgi:hypothetical protein